MRRGKPRPLPEGQREPRPNLFPGVSSSVDLGSTGFVGARGGPHPLEAVVVSNLRSRQALLQIAQPRAATAGGRGASAPPALAHLENALMRLLDDGDPTTSSGGGSIHTSGGANAAGRGQSLARHHHRQQAQRKPRKQSARATGGSGNSRKGLSIAPVITQDEALAAAALLETSSSSDSGDGEGSDPPASAAPSTAIEVAGMPLAPVDTGSGATTASLPWELPNAPLSRTDRSGNMDNDPEDADDAMMVTAGEGKPASGITGEAISASSSSSSSSSSDEQQRSADNDCNTNNVAASDCDDASSGVADGPPEAAAVTAETGGANSIEIEETGDGPAGRHEGKTTVHNHDSLDEISAGFASSTRMRPDAEPLVLPSSSARDGGSIIAALPSPPSELEEPPASASEAPVEQEQEQELEQEVASSVTHGGIPGCVRCSLQPMLLNHEATHWLCPMEPDHKIPATGACAPPICARCGASMTLKFATSSSSPDTHWACSSQEDGCPRFQAAEAVVVPAEVALAVERPDTSTAASSGVAGHDIDGSMHAAGSGTAIGVQLTADVPPSSSSSSGSAASSVRLQDSASAEPAAKRRKLQNAIIPDHDGDGTDRDRPSLETKNDDKPTSPRPVPQLAAIPTMAIDPAWEAKRSVDLDPANKARLEAGLPPMTKSSRRSQPPAHGMLPYR